MKNHGFPDTPSPTRSASTTHEQEVNQSDPTGGAQSPIPKKLYGGYGLINIPTDLTGQATGRRIWRKFAGQPEKLVYEIPDNVTTKQQDQVR